ncbi:MAG: phosphoribosyltransferase [archaeon]
MFENRTEAGERLAAELTERGLEADIVVAIPRGGLPIGRVVADALEVSLDIVAAKKLGAPGNSELAIGAVAADGTTWLNDDIVARFDLEEFQLADAIERERAGAQEKIDRYRGERPPLDLTGKRVVVVDDGVATGATTTACLRSVRQCGPARTILAVPVGPPRTIDRLEREADDVICVETPMSFQAVGQFYESFPQVSDEEAAAYLE